ncbi:MAG: DNA-processing protein DprA [Roseburia sp.]|nr:DNA-processing protein DprA [Roseburia sp.]
MREEKYYAQWLCSLLSMNGRALKRLEEVFAGPGEVFEASEEALSGLLTPGQLKELVKSRKRYGGLPELITVYEEMEEAGIRFVWRREAEFPKRLLQIPDSPLGLYYRGSLPGGDRASVAIIGARECSAYGSYVATKLGSYLGEQGVEVISGMARGIDGIAQEAALSAGGNSYGVLGCGVDICYPASNRRLYERLLLQGGILSAYPPGTEPLSRNFPPRNRIVSGLADAVIVVEARLKSGTLITVDMALEQGREVYVVPGRITDRLSDGCNRLIQQGAEALLSPEELVAKLYGIRPGQQTLDCQAVEEGKEQSTVRGNSKRGGLKGEGEREPGFEGELGRVYDCLSFTPCSVDGLREILPDMECARLNVLLMRLCVEGAARQVSSGYFVKT